MFLHSLKSGNCTLILFILTWNYSRIDKFFKNITQKFIFFVSFIGYLAVLLCLIEFDRICWVILSFVYYSVDLLSFLILITCQCYLYYILIIELNDSIPHTHVNLFSCQNYAHRYSYNWKHLEFYFNYLGEECWTSFIN